MKITVFLLAFSFPLMLFAQSVAINTDGSPPDNNAILDIKSNSKGLLMPRLTTAQRTGIISPVPGLTVFDSETFSYWVYRGELNGGWSEILSTFDNHWNRTGSTVYNTNPGNIGIGTSSPTQKLAINGTDPAIDFMNAGTSKGYLQANGNNMRIGTYANNSTGNIVFNTKAVDRMWIDEAGKVGIATSTPNGALTIDGSNPFIEMRTSGVYKGYLWASGSDLRLGTSITNTTGNLALQTKLLTRMIIDENGKVAIGTTTPSPNGIFTINDVNPLIQLENNGVGRGFIQVLDQDIKIGTNTSNVNGNFIIRTAGTDRLAVNSSGWVTIGSENNSSYLILRGFTPTIDLYRNNISAGRIEASDFANKDLNITRNSMGNSGVIKLSNGFGSIRLSEDGHVNFGSGLKPSGYRVSVEGKIIATEFTALNVGSWPDYVFEDDYKLNPLAEVKKFITENKHLPNIPSAKEIEKNGIQLGDMSNRLMEKVEELTLYVIELNEKNIQLQKQVDELKKSNQR